MRDNNSLSMKWTHEFNYKIDGGWVGASKIKVRVDIQKLQRPVHTNGHGKPVK